MTLVHKTKRKASIPDFSHRHPNRLNGFGASDTSPLTDNVNFESIGTIVLGDTIDVIWRSWIGVDMDMSIAIGGGTWRIRRLTTGVVVSGPFTIVGGQNIRLQFDLSLSADANLRYRVEGKVNAAGDEINVDRAIAFAMLDNGNVPL